MQCMTIGIHYLMEECWAVSCIVSNAVDFICCYSEDKYSIVTKMRLLKDGMQGDGYLQFPSMMNVMV